MKMTPEQRAKFIEWAKAEFGTALESMLADGHTMHAFDCVGTKDGEKSEWSFLITFLPKDQLEKFFGKGKEVAA